MTNEPEPNTRAGEALKPCPVCGAGAISHRNPGLAQWAVSCTRCDCKPLNHCARTEAEAITAWNTRPLTQPSELVDDLHNEADLCRNEGADDIAKLLDQAAAQIAKLQAERDHYAGLYAERCGDVAKLQADGDKLAGALRGLVDSFEKHRPKQLWDNARQALTEWKDRA